MSPPKPVEPGTTPTEAGFKVALGDLVITFQTLEWSLSFFVWLMLSEGNDMTVGSAVTSGMRFSDLVSLIRRLYGCRVGDVRRRKAVEGVLKRAEEANRQRNEALHSFWSFGNAEMIHAMKLTRKGKFGVSARSGWIRAEDIEKLSSENRNLTSDIMKLQADYVSHVKTPEDKHH